MKKSVGALLALVLSACATAAPVLPPTEAEYGAPPTNPDAIVKAYLQGILKDPESLRLRGDAAPFRIFYAPCCGIRFVGWAVCRGVNAKNGFGGYTGEKTYAFIVKDDGVVHALAEDASFYMDAQAAVQQCAGKL